MNNAKRPTGPKFTEFRLKSHYQPKESHHIMMLPNSHHGGNGNNGNVGFTIQEHLVQPVKLYRRRVEGQEGGGLGGLGELEGHDAVPLEAIGGSQGRPGGGRKKRTQVLREWISHEERTTREVEQQPLRLEDSDGHAYQGRLEGGMSSRSRTNSREQGSKYVLFVNQGNEFRVIPISRWYRFTPKITYPTLALEEAEERVCALP